MRDGENAPEWIRLALSSIGDAVIATDAEGRVAFMNAVAETLTGWPQADALGRPLPEVFHIVNEETREPTENPALRALSEGTVVGLANHTILIARDGTERPIDDSAAPMVEGNKSVGAVLVFRDVSERKRAEADRARLAAIVSSSEDAIVSKSLDGTILSWNSGAQRLFGYSPDEAIGRSVTMLIPGELLDEERSILARLRRGDRVDHFETVRIRKDGSRVDISLSVSPIRDTEGRVIAASKIARDITERKRADLALRNSESLHRVLVRLATETQPLSDPAKIMAVTAAVLADHLKVDRCAYAEVEAEKTFVITGDHSNEIPTIVGRWEIAAFGAEHHRMMLAGEPYVVVDTETDPRITPEDLEAYRVTAIRAVICVPLLKGGRLTAAMAVHQTVPRHWTDGEVQLVTTVVGRCWEAIERARIASELRDIRSRMEAAVEAGAIGTWAWDVQGDRFYGDPSLARIFSAPPEAVSGGPLSRLMDSIHPDDRHRVGELVHRVINSGDRYEADYRVTDGSGGWRWVNARGQVERDAEGRAVRFPGVVIDITDRKRVEEALAWVTAELDRRKRLYEAVLSTTPDLAYVWGLDHRFLYVNEGLLRMWGKTWEEAIGRNCLELGYEPWHAEMHDREIDQVRATRQPYRGEVPFTGTFGRRVYDYILVPVIGADGEVEAVAGTTRDVTERKAAEEAIRKQTERLRLLWETAAVLLTTDEPDAMIRGLFERIAGHFGLDAYFNFTVDGSGEVLLLASCSGIPPEAANSIRRLQFGQAVCGTVAATREPITATHIQDSSDPLVQYIKRFGLRAYACNPLIADDRLLGTLSFASRTRDWFDPDELEFLRTICRYVTSAYDRIRLIRELREADRKKDDFIALLAHELRNPLAPIRNGLQVVRLSNDFTVRRDAQAMMDRQLAHMVRLIDDLLDVSRINRNKMELRRTRLSLSEVVASAVETARPVIDAEGHELTVSLPGGAIYLHADLTRLAQVFSNLLTNSAKYTPKGGRIWLAAERSSVGVTVTVHDNGIGIPATALPTIFDMFSQVDRPVERSAGGLGIGLALVKGLVEMHGGSVSVASEGEGKGSTFTVALPVLECLPDPVGVMQERETVGRRRQRVLVVDDNRDGADSLAMMLGLLGHEVETAYDGVEAVTVAERFQPGIILMDVGMPRLNGLDATRQIRAQPWGTGIKIIALTGWGQEGDRDRSRAAGCNGHLVKPIDAADLEKVLADLYEPRGQ